MSSRVVRVADASTVAVASAVACTVATAVITSVQYYYGSKGAADMTTLKKDIETVQTDVDTMKTDMATMKNQMFNREDIKDLVKEVMTQSPWLRTRKIVYSPYPK